ncbi:hypothetical protein D7Z54_09990 [Salibacterium salarium]|uniref:Transposase IS200-like domain-containing protein n=1 Tax=Salibacterium salarium TaxID=284579 RepID=A0A3R9QUB4_9BACI|nr:transposase [Salibacterium salarium]RSL33630.1 hypothetical protein D7Z54_09990 [Salibacterium salarium]
MSRHQTTPTYHIMIRSERNAALFYDQKDYSHYLHLLTKMKHHSPFNIHAYSMIPSQIHLLVEPLKTKVSTIIRYIQTTYGVYFNRRYEGNGLIFKGEFLFQGIKDDTHFFQTSRFIHRVPTAQKITANIHHYRWSSARDYLSPQAEEAPIHPFLTLDRTLDSFSLPKHERFHDFLYTSTQMKINSL